MMEDKLLAAIKECEELPDSAKQKIHNKYYSLVHTRVQIFRKHLGSDGKIETIILEQDDHKVIVQAVISIWRNDNWVQIANDFAEEYRDQGMVNKTSALENCTTSSIGRALSACGLTGGEYASAFEVDNAINSKPEAKPKKIKKPDTSWNYTVRIGKDGDTLFTSKLQKFVAWCGQYIQEPENELHVKHFQGTQLEIEKALKDHEISKDQKAILEAIMEKFGGQNAN